MKKLIVILIIELVILIVIIYSLISAYQDYKWIEKTIEAITEEDNKPQTPYKFISGANIPSTDFTNQHLGGSTFGNVVKRGEGMFISLGEGGKEIKELKEIKPTTIVLKEENKNFIFTHPWTIFKQPINKLIIRKKDSASLIRYKYPNDNVYLLLWLNEIENKNLITTEEKIMQYVVNCKNREFTEVNNNTEIDSEKLKTLNWRTIEIDNHLSELSSNLCETPRAVGINIMTRLLSENPDFTIINLGCVKRAVSPFTTQIVPENHIRVLPLEELEFNCI